MWKVMVLLQALAGFALMLLTAWHMTRPKPAYEDRFAAKEHTHSDLAKKAEVASLQAQMDGNFRESRQTDREVTKKLDDLRELVSKNNSNLHRRLDPVTRAVSVNQALLKEHLEQHKNENTKTKG